MDRTCEESPSENSSNEEEDLDSTKAAPRIRDTPEDIVLEAPASGLAFHPTRDLLAAGDVDGDVFVLVGCRAEVWWARGLQGLKALLGWR